MVDHPTLGNSFAFNKQIGLYSFDRPRSSCVHATVFCHATCYKWKAYRTYKENLPTRDARCEIAWQENDVASLRRWLVSPAKLIKRVRMFSRGEGFVTLDDIDRARNILRACPETDFMWPTRAWRDPHLRPQIKALQEAYQNFKLLASTDPETTPEEWAMLKAEGWNTMFYGNDRAYPGVTEKPAKCPKIWKSLKGHCSICKLCFSGRHDIWLKQH